MANHATPAPDAQPPAPSQVGALTAVFDAVRAEHVIDVMQSSLLACICGERLPIVYNAEGQPRYNPAIRHHHEQYARAVTARVSEFQWNALEMARNADAAERRAEEAEFHVEQLRDARDRAERRIEAAEALLDGWEHDGPDGHEFRLLIQRVREALGEVS